MVMVWLEGGQGDVRGACAPPPPTTPNCPTWTPRPTDLPNPPHRSSLNPPPMPPPPRPRSGPKAPWRGGVAYKSEQTPPPPL